MTKEQLAAISSSLYWEIERLMHSTLFMREAPEKHKKTTKRMERMSKARTQIVNILNEWDD